MRYGLPVWAVDLATAWLPNNRIANRIRGLLFSPFLGSCGRNLQVAARVTLLNTHRMYIGNDVYIGYSAWLNGLGGLHFDHEVILGPFVSISTLTHVRKDGSFRFGGAQSASVRIGRGSWLAAHVSVSSGVTIGNGVLVAANAAVTKDVPDDVTVGGVPARIIGKATDSECAFRSRREL